MFLLNLLSIFLLMAQAAEKPICDAKSVTRNCDYFKERSHQPVIKLSDGSTLANPMFDYDRNNIMAEFGGETKKSEKGNNPAATNEDVLFNQSEVIDAMEKTSFSTRFKMSYASLASELALFPEKTFEIPWPPMDKNAKKQLLKSSEIATYLKNNMEAKDYARLEEKIKIQSGPLQRKIEEEQRYQQKLLADNKRYAEEKQAMTALRDKKKLRLKEIFIYVKEHIKAMIKRGKKDSELTVEERTAIDKVETLEMTDPDNPEVAKNSRCSGNAENAFYLPGSHTLSFCPAQVMKSDASLVYIMAHEMGHSIDPCYSRMPLWKVDSKKLEILMKDPTLTEDEKSVLMKTLPIGIKMVNYDLDLVHGNPEFTKRLIAKGVLNKVQEGIRQDHYPFRKEYDCFVKESFFRENSAKDIAITKEYFQEHSQGVSANTVLDQKSLQRYSENLDKYPQCLKTMAPVSQMGETMADMVGAVIAEKYILENPFKTEDEKVAAINFIGNTCKPNEQGSLPPGAFSPNKTQEIYFLNHYSDPHALDAQRVEKLMLNLPGMAQVYNCQRKVAACFDHLSFSTRMTSAVPDPVDTTKAYKTNMERGQK